MADFCSDFCCSVTFTLFYFSYISHFLTSFSFVFCSISLICGQLVCLPVLLVRFGSFSLLVCTVAGRQWLNKKMIHVVQLFAVHQQFSYSVCCSFEWLSSISLSAMVRLQFMVHAGRLVRSVVQLLVQLVR